MNRQINTDFLLRISSFVPKEPQQCLNIPTIHKNSENVVHIGHRETKPYLHCGSPPGGKDG